MTYICYIFSSDFGGRSYMHIGGIIPPLTIFFNPAELGHQACPC